MMDMSAALTPIMTPTGVVNIDETLGNACDTHQQVKLPRMPLPLLRLYVAVSTGSLLHHHYGLAEL